MNDDLVVLMIAAFRRIPGKKVFQKLAYFLQEGEGTRLGVRFRMKHFGPYSAELDYGLQDLADRRLVSVIGSSEDGFVIECQEEASRAGLPAQDQRALEKLATNFIGYLTHGWTLELLATLHYLAKGSSYRGTQDDRERLLKQVRVWKGSKFTDDFIQEQIDRLEELGYLPQAEAA